MCSCEQDSGSIAYKSHKVGEPIDRLNNINVYYNGETILKSYGTHNVDGYYCGKKWQCVEFIKRYYFLHLKHKMPDGYGHASSFYNKNLKDNALNKARGLKQFSNPSKSKPSKDDIVVWGGDYGHVAIVSQVLDNKIEVVQQNVGISTRSEIGLHFKNGQYKLEGDILGWLRK